MDSREEIKAKLSIYDLVSRYVELRKAGRNFKGLCPFHNEKTPSFMVSPEKDIAYCFGCHKGGDIFAFYQLVEGVEFPDALKALAETTGVELEVQNVAKSHENKSKKIKLIDVHEAATSFYEDNLHDTSEGKKVLKYLKGRGLSDETIKEFRLGFSPDSYDATYKELIKNGFSKGDLVESGIASSKDTDSVSLFDRFRLRLMFPIFNKHHEVIAFGGRALKKDEPAKYLNSPETFIYHKSEVLYGFSHAKDYIRNDKSVIVVEGYFDQIMCYQAGFKNVVAVSGTALTARHVDFLKRFADTIYFAFDSDSAGQEALLRSAELAFASEFYVKVIDLGESKDPADVIHDDPSCFEDALNHAKDFFDYVLDSEFMQIPESERFSMQNVAQFLEKVLPVVDRINSSITKDIVLRKLAQFLQTKIEFLYDELNRLKKGALKKVASKPEGPTSKFEFSSEDYFWCYLILNPKLYNDFAEELKEKSFLLTQNQVYKSIDHYYNTSSDLSGMQLSDLDINKTLTEKYSVLVLYLESVHADEWSEEDVKIELSRLLTRMTEDYKRVEGARVQRALEEAEKNSDKESIEELLTSYNNILSL